MPGGRSEQICRTEVEDLSVRVTVTVTAVVGGRVVRRRRGRSRGMTERSIGSDVGLVPELQRDL